MPKIVTTALDVLGFGLVVAGVAWVSVPAGLIAGGVATLAVSYLASAR